MVRQSFAWSLQAIGRPDDALKALRAHVRTISDARQRDDLRSGPPADRNPVPGERGGPETGSAAGAKAPQAAPVDPNAAYTPR